MSEVNKLIKKYRKLVLFNIQPKKREMFRYNSNKIYAETVMWKTTKL